MINRNIIIDGVSYDVAISELKRSADILDKAAYRSEDGELHREVIGTYYNYTLAIGVINNDEVYNKIFEVLSEPVAYHEVTLPHDNVSFKGYFGSVKDEISRLTDTGAKFKGLTCNLVAVSPTIRADSRGILN